jgi:hypothetical protein
MVVLLNELRKLRALRAWAMFVLPQQYAFNFHSLPIGIKERIANWH